MSKESRIKEEISWYKIIFAIFTATDLSLIAWFVQNFEQSGFFILLLCAVSIIGITAMLMFINRKVFGRLDHLEEL